MATTPTKNPGPPPLTAVIDQGPQAGAVCNRVRPRSVNTPVGMVVDAIECQRQWGRSVWRFHSLQHRRHLLVHEVDGLQRTNHHSKLDNPPLIVAADDVDSVDVLPLHGGLELQDCSVVTEHSFGVMEAPASTGAFWARFRTVPRKGQSCCLQIERRDLLAPLRRKDDWGVEDDLVVEQLIEPAGQLTTKVGVPFFNNSLNMVSPWRARNVS